MMDLFGSSGAMSRDLTTSPEVRSILNSVNSVFRCLHRLEFSFPLWKIYSTADWKEFLQASDNLATIFKRFIDEAEQNLRETDNTDKELSAFEKLLKIDKDVAITMTMDMLQAGIDTVRILRLTNFGQIWIKELIFELRLNFEKTSLSSKF